MSQDGLEEVHHAAGCESQARAVEYELVLITPASAKAHLSLSACSRKTEILLFWIKSSTTSLFFFLLVSNDVKVMPLVCSA